MNISTSSQRMHIHQAKNYPFLQRIVGPPSPYRSARHLHEELEISLNPGRIWHTVCRGKTHHISPNAILLTPPEEPHIAFSPEQGSTYYLGLRIHPASLTDMLSEMTERPQTMLFFPELLINETIFSQHLLALHSMLETGQNSRLEQDALLQHIMLHLIRVSSSHIFLHSSGQEPGAIKIAKMYIQEHYQENISLQQLAQQVNLSPFYFSRIFHAALVHSQ
ncbi:hypothetical protein KDA_13540 [Dictyobacter alpinus]|uniref:HTH araC/xylS-type domain-containing protein n=1 Tax=Dictyobacter alpinus TaxID=2014873 RepID=A0A402B3D3_9CHLR|nr:AraC family ligand binding domain-containing protein [Dictyobacter alpinus]GCE25870.1 hypothetical protein KDA_13540 [Dictyobacter alpinus]